MKGLLHSAVQSQNPQNTTQEESAKHSTHLNKDNPKESSHQARVYSYLTNPIIQILTQKFYDSGSYSSRFWVRFKYHSKTIIGLRTLLHGGDVNKIGEIQGLYR